MTPDAILKFHASAAVSIYSAKQYRGKNRNKRWRLLVQENNLILNVEMVYF